MLALRLLGAGGALVAQELADPRPGAGEVVVEVCCAGICHSDAHYRADPSRVRLPITLGHEVAGVVREVGAGVRQPVAGDRVALHYLFPNGDMLGKERDGGWAERVVVPAASAVPVPASVPLAQAAIMMCSTATALHALRATGLRAGESLVILGFGGLGVSTLRLGRALGADAIYVVEPVAEKRALARAMGAEPVSVDELPPADVALDLAGHPPTTLAALRALAPGGRLGVVAINLRTLELDAYRDLLAHGRSLVGCADHTREELVELLELAGSGALDLTAAITRRVPLEAGAVTAVLDELERGTPHLRTVIAVRDEPG
jgi:propanol-preferring alcohol dehydrogenase